MSQPSRIAAPFAPRATSLVVVGAVCALGVWACSGLKDGTSVVQTPPDAAPDATLVEGDAVAASDSEIDASADVSTAPGPLEVVAEKLPGGLGVAVSSSHVYWFEQGARAGTNFDAMFRRLPIAQVCPAGQNCGAVVPRTQFVPHYFGDYHLGPVASDSVACVEAIYNVTRETEINCIRQTDGIVVRAPATYFASTIEQVLGTDVYFATPARAPATTSTVRKWSVVTPDTPAVEVLTREAAEISSFFADGTTWFWLEKVGTMTSLWTQVAARSPELLAAPRPGGGVVTADAQFVYVARSTEGVILRYPRTGLSPGSEIVKSVKTPAALLLRGPYLMFLAHGDAPDYTNSEFTRCSRDGTNCVVLSKDPNLSGIAANATTAFAVSFGQPPNFEGTVKRIRF